ncbi:MAG: molybdate transport system permease protein [Frankiaceae bacterium]|nr:molybdate transport system permease protein [Frankiaceae bacterium]
MTRTPRLVALLAGVGLLLLALPVVALMVRAPWSRLGSLLSSGPSLEALRLSLVTATAAALLSAVIGVPLAWVMARSRVRFAALLRAVVTLPLVLPPVVGGVALLLTFGRTGVVGRPLYELTGHALPYSTAGVIVAEAFVAMPFLVIAVDGALRQSDARHEEVLATLGVPPGRVFTRVTLPLVRSGIGAGLTLAWARALGEFGATVTFAGSFPGRTRTLPLEVYRQLELDPDAATALAMLLLGVAVVVLVALRGRWTQR